MKAYILMLLLLVPAANAGALHPYLCDGTATDTMDEGDDLCVYGTGFEPDTTIDVMVVQDDDSSAVVTQEMTITERGILAFTKLWGNVKQGFYDIVADLNRNGEIDDGDVVNVADGPGLTVRGDRSQPEAEVPEFSTLTALLALAGANYYIYRKRRSA